MFKVPVCKLKVKISSECFDYFTATTDPDKRKRSFPSFVDKLPKPVSCSQHIVRYEFVRTMKAPTSFNMGHFARAL